MNINKNCFLDMVIDERMEACFTGEKVENCKANRRGRARIFIKNIQRSAQKETKQTHFEE